MTSRQHAAAIRKTLSTVQPGQALCFKLPGAQPNNRIAYQRINGVAYALWGAGAYRLRAARGEVIVQRKAP